MRTDDILNQAHESVKQIEKALRQARWALDLMTWISVDDRLPEEGVRVWTIDDVRETKVSARRPTEGAYCFEDSQTAEWAGDITHWMPLPDPPK